MPGGQIAPAVVAPAPTATPAAPSPPVAANNVATPPAQRAVASPAASSRTASVLIGGLLVLFVGGSVYGLRGLGRAHARPHRLA
jgi:hypothetical protein